MLKQTCDRFLPQNCLYNIHTSRLNIRGILGNFSGLVFLGFGHFPWIDSYYFFPSDADQLFINSTVTFIGNASHDI